MIPAFDTIRLAIPELAEFRGSPDLIEHGQNSLVWDTGSHIIRVPRYPEARSGMELEARVLADIGHLLPVATPHITLYTVDQHLVSVHPKLPGAPLSSLAAYARDAQARMLAQIGTFLHAIHTIPPNHLAHLGIPTADRDVWASLVARTQAEIHPHLDPAARDRFDALAHAFLDTIDTLPLQLRHGDFGSGNILAHDTHISGIVDFAGMSVGDPASDIAGLVASFGQACIETVAQTYPAARDMMPRATFYRLAFAAMEALHGIDHADAEALRAGVKTLNEQAETFP